MKNCTNIPTGELTRETLDVFYPDVMKELSKELAHQKDGRTHRKTREYGYSFFKMEKGDRSYTPAPKFLQELGNKVCETLGHPEQKFTNFIISKKAFLILLTSSILNIS